jgi:hypothetical protein
MLWQLSQDHTALPSRRLLAQLEEEMKVTEALARVEAVVFSGTFSPKC